MRRRAASAANSVTLFPFLAVLVCAMGALILLLLVSTRQIRSRTQAVAQPPVSITELPDERQGLNQSPQSVTEQLAEPEAEVAVIVAAEPPADSGDEVEPGDEPVDPLFAAVTQVDVEQARAELRHWTARLTALDKQQRRANDSVRQLSDALEHHADTHGEFTRKLKQVAEELESADAAVQTQLAEATELAQRRTELRRQISAAERRLNSLIQQQATAEPKYAVLPYDGRSGTARRPIFIECRENSVWFPAEQIELPVDKLEPFATAGMNPLSAGAVALMKYWQDHADGDADETLGRPYVLLIVRPDGIESFYAARHMLRVLGDDYGYELVRDDQDVAWPDSPQAARVECQAAIDRLLSRSRPRSPFGSSPATAVRGRPAGPGDNPFAGNGSIADAPAEPDVPVRLSPHQRRARELTLGGTGSVESDTRLGARDGWEGGAAGQGWESEKSDRPKMTGSGMSKPTGTRGSADRATTRGGVSDPSSEPFAMSASEPQPPIANSELNNRGGQAENSATGGASRPDTPGQTDPWRRRAASDDPATSARQSFPEAGAADGEPSHWAEANDRSKPEASASQTATTPGADDSFSPDTTAQAAVPPLTIERRRTAAPANWNQRRPGTIGFKRSLRVTVKDAAIHVPGQPPVSVETSGSSRELAADFARAVHSHVRGWGAPPDNFYWLPVIDFALDRQAYVHNQRLQDLARAGGFELGRVSLLTNAGASDR